METLVITNIVYDTDGEKVDIPTEITICKRKTDKEAWERFMDDYIYDTGDIVDYISDITGFLIKSCEIDLVAA